MIWICGIMVIGSFVVVGVMAYFNYFERKQYFDLLNKNNRELLKQNNDLLNKKLAPDWFTYVNGTKLMKDNQVALDFADNIGKDNSKEPVFPKRLHPEGGTNFVPPEAK